MPYRGNPSTDTSDEFRLLIGDIATTTTGEIFADGEVDYFVANYSNVPLAASAAVKTLMGSTRATALAGVVYKQVGDLRIDRGGGGTDEVLSRKAAELRSLGVRKVKPYAGGISISDKDSQESDSDWEKPNFNLGMHDNPNGSTAGSTFG